MFPTVLITILITATVTSLAFHFVKKEAVVQTPLNSNFELWKFVEKSAHEASIPAEIKDYLLSVINADQNDHEKFNEEQLIEAQRILDRAGPGALYWMSEIATQLAFLASAQMNGFNTNINDALGNSASPEEIVDLLVKV